MIKRPKMVRVTKKRVPEAYNDSIYTSVASPAQHIGYISYMVLLPIVDSFEHSICTAFYTRTVQFKKKRIRESGVKKYVNHVFDEMSD